jgi:hypothetical protein
MAYDPELRQLIMFGGSTQYAPLNDTWAWDGRGWTQLHPANAPSGGGSMVYDAATKQLLLFSSQPGVWAWINGDWVRTKALPAPSCVKLPGGNTSCASALGRNPEYVSSAVYSDELRKLVLLAGPTTWTWDGTTWAYIGPLDNNNANCFCLTYDGASRQVLTLAYSGGKLSPAAGHTLIFDGSQWRMAGSQAPVVTQALWAYDAASATVLLVAVNEKLRVAGPAFDVVVGLELLASTQCRSSLTAARCQPCL